MGVASVTRLKLRSWLTLPQFLLMALRSNAQAACTPGFRAGQLLVDRGNTFWTLTTWDDDEAVKRFMFAGAHAQVMPKLMTWCDEASLARWPHDDQTLPSWDVAHAKLHEVGRASRVKFPSPRHKDLAFPPPRTTIVQPIMRKVL